MLTSEEYVELAGGECPNCGASDIGVTDNPAWSVGPENIILCQTVSCGNCSATWAEHYTLCGYGDLDTPKTAPMTCHEHLTEVAVSLVDAKYHLEAAETISVRDRVHPIYKDAIRTVAKLLTNAENIVNGWRREIKEESEK